MLRNSGCLEASFQVSEPNPKLTYEDCSSRIVYKHNTERAVHRNQKFPTNMFGRNAKINSFIIMDFSLDRETRKRQQI